MISVTRIQFFVIACCAMLAALGPERTDAHGQQVAKSPANTRSPALTAEAPPAPTGSATAAAPASPKPAAAELPGARKPVLNPALFKTPSPKEAQLAELLNRPMRYFGDTTWNCETFAGSSETLTYDLTDGVGFVLHNVLRTWEGQTYRYDEKYSFAFSRHTWRMRQADGVYVAKSVVSNHSYWIFEGNDLDAAPTLVRMRYHLFDENYFRRDFEVLRTGHWVPYSGETCERSDSSGQQ